MPLSRPDSNARIIFYVGIFGLPWLWIVNVLYHWEHVYGKTLPCCVDSDLPAEESTLSRNEDQGDGEGRGILSQMVNDAGVGNRTECAEQIPSDKDIQANLCKWVKRSTIGSLLYTTGFITWILVFQLNQDSFGPSWFVMPQQEELRTGW